MAVLRSEFDRWLSWAKRQQGRIPAHTTFFRLAKILLAEGRCEEDILHVLRAVAAAVRDRRVPERELTSAIAYAKAAPGPGASPRWPGVNLALRAEIERSATLSDLVKASPCFPANTAEALYALFPDNPLLCLGAEVNSFATAPLAEWRHLEAAQFVVPNPMRARTGRTLEGRLSARTNANTGPRAYLVVEFDFGHFDGHAALLLHLRQYAHLAMAVYSGGKSLHGWFDVRGQSAEAQRRFFARAVELGADPKMWTPSQFSRCPLGSNRRTGRLQQVYFFDPQWT
ncbi:MAG: hypothetical protein D6701_00145 [Gemmatimonadetes bacterium]|nr:MAG: hypothetical protein D6701_00145 [Gemmatimonadota bacterium]